MGLNIGDEVVIKNKSNLIFRFADFSNGKAILFGKNFRLIKEEEVSNLLPAPYYRSSIPELPNILRSKAKLKIGKVLHIDGDEYYLNKALQIYKYYSVPAVGYHIKEINIADVAMDLVTKHNPSIVVLTGHDGIKTGCENNLYDETSYRYSSFYAKAIKSIRNKRPNLDDLVIISGACQSYYELLIDAGSNFASSPSRDFIHLLDPVIIATCIATSSIYETVDIEEVIEKTITKHIGGLDTRGKARKIYDGG